MNKHIILASQSPQRQEILKSIGINFQIITPNIPETSDLTKPSFFVKELAYQKAEQIKNTINHKAIIIAADTIVFCKGEIIGKPKSIKNAKRILNKIIKYPQCVYTGFTVIGSVSGPVGSGSTSTDFTSSGDGDLIIPAATISDLFRGTFAAEDKIFISVNKWNKQIASIAANLAAGEIMRSISYSEVISPDDSISYRFTNKAKGMLDRLQRPFAVDGARLSTLPSMPVDDIQLGNWDGDVYDKFGQINTDYISDSDVLNYNS